MHKLSHKNKVMVVIVLKFAPVYICIVIASKFYSKKFFYCKYYRAYCMLCGRRSYSSRPDKILQASLFPFSRPYLHKQKNFYKEYKQIISIRDFRTLHKTWRRRLIIDQAWYRKQCYATGIVRTMSNFLRLRYILLGTAGAGAVGSKMVSMIIY